METSSYGTVARTFHWLIAGLILAQFALANVAEGYEDASGSSALAIQLALWANHKSLGMLILFLTVARLGWRFVGGAPELPTTMPRWQRRLAMVTHGLLYGVVLMLPVSGWILSSAAAYSVSFFNLFAFPDLVAQNDGVEQIVTEVHHVLATVLVVLAALHVGAALIHGLWYRDGVAGRMVRGRWVVLAVVVAAAVIAALVQPSVFRSSSSARPAPTQGTPVAAPVQGAQTSTLPLWQLDQDASYIEFSGVQTGAPFRGRWANFTAEVGFDPQQLEASSARVVVLTNSNATGDGERDDTMRSSEWFDVGQFPTAEFRTSGFRRAASGYEADGLLRLRNVEGSVLLRFDARLVDRGWVLDGSSRIDRLAFGLGSGSWTDLSLIGQFVDVTVHLETTVSPGVSPAAAPAPQTALAPGAASAPATAVAP